ncbi:hypothetical protein LTR15_001206 [Elasticomyces elasticus]|nr:hypothetical protein LTR15_001206 [Elasticomyces elasticus]
MAPRNQRKEIAQQLERDSRKIVAAFTEHKLLDDEITAIMHPGLVTWFDGLPNATSAAEHVQNLDTLSMGHPNWEVHVVNGCASARNGYGTVWLTINITGIPDKGFENMQREAVCIMSWRKQGNGKWLLWEHRTWRGPGIFLLP